MTGLAQETFDTLMSMNAYINATERALANIPPEQRAVPSIEARVTELMERLYEAKTLRDKLVEAAKAMRDR